MTTVLLDTHDLDAAEAAVSALWPHFRIRAVNDRHASHMRIRRASLGSLHVDDVEIDYDVNFRAEPTDSLQLVCVRAGAIEHEHGGDTIRYGPGRAGGFGGVAGEAFAGRMLKARFHLISMRRDALTDVSAGAAPVHLTSVDPVSDTANRQLVRVADYVCTTATAGTGGSPSPLIAGAVERLVAATVLAALPSTAVIDSSAESPGGAPAPALLRRALAFIDQHARDEIKLDDIAGAVYVTPRALQYMFRKHRGVTPMEHLRNVRLANVRSDLMVGSRMTTSVSEVARRWGFGHLGRFATNYRLRYGESPHETLRG